MTAQQLRDRDFRNPIYNAVAKLEIIKKQLHRSFTGSAKMLKYDKRVLIDAAALLTLQLFQMENTFIKTGKIDKGFHPALNAYQKILFRLGQAPPKAKKPEGPLGLEEIIHGSDS